MKIHSACVWFGLQCASRVYVLFVRCAVYIRCVFVCLFVCFMYNMHYINLVNLYYTPTMRAQISISLDVWNTFIGCIKFVCTYKVSGFVPFGSPIVSMPWLG